MHENICLPTFAPKANCQTLPCRFYSVRMRKNWFSISKNSYNQINHPVVPPCTGKAELMRQEKKFRRASLIDPCTYFLFQTLLWLFWTGWLLGIQVKGCKIKIMKQITHSSETGPHYALFGFRISATVRYPLTLWAWHPLFVAYSCSSPPTWFKQINYSLPAGT